MTEQHIDSNRHDELFEAYNSDSRIDLNYIWEANMSNIYSPSKSMQQYDSSNALVKNVSSSNRSNEMYRSAVFSPDEGFVKRSRPYDPSDEFLTMPKPVYDPTTYCCCKSKKQCFRLSLIIFALMALFLGLVGYFCWPRIPKFDVSDSATDLKGLQFSSTNSNNDPLRALRSASFQNPFKASISFSVPVTANSSNYIDIYVGSINLSIKIISPMGIQIPFLNGQGELNKIVISKLASTVLYFVISLF